jgi:ATP/maltotriose-dependent transcriptional regulator MalT
MPTDPGTLVHRWRIRRERVVARIRVSAEQRVSLLIAPAGFGKSIALRAAFGAARDAAFYRVPADTTTLLAFLRGLTDALESDVPGAHLSFAIAYERAIQSPTPASELARWLGEHLREAGTLRIVIDDLHNASAPEIPEFVRASIEAAPDEVRWVLALRDASAYPLASWLALGVCTVPLDEAGLRFTQEEGAQLAAQAAPDRPAGEIESMLERTGGGPAAFALALLAGFVNHAAATPAQLYDELAARVVDGLAEPDRRALATAAIFADVPGSAADENPYLDDLGNGRLRFDELFRDFLLRRLRAEPTLERDALVAAAGAYERSGDARSALAFYQRAGEPAAIGRLLAGHGVALMDEGFADVVDAAIVTLDRAAFDGGPSLMLLKAIRDARFARFDSAEAWFQLAIAATAAGDDLQLRIVHRYALDLVRRGRVDVIEVLEPVVAAAPADHPFTALLSATLATAYALVDRFDDARTAIASAMRGLQAGLPAALRTRAYHQAAYVALRCADIEGARRYAEGVLEVAVPNGLYDLAARAHSILYEIAHAWEIDPERALAHAESVAAHGLKAGDTHIRQWALLTVYYIEAERGNAPMMSTIERALNAPELLQTTEETSAALLPGQALRATWSGDFGHAFRLLANSAGGQVSADRRALRWAEIALFAAASGALAEAREAAAAAQNELAAGHAGKHATVAATYSLIALSLLGDRMTWLTLHDSLVAEERLTPGRFFIDTAETLHKHWHEKSDHHAVLAVFSALRERGFGGIAAMLETLPRRPANALQTFP